MFGSFEIAVRGRRALGLVASQRSMACPVRKIECQDNPSGGLLGARRETGRKGRRLPSASTRSKVFPLRVGAPVLRGSLPALYAPVVGRNRRMAKAPDFKRLLAHPIKPIGGPQMLLDPRGRRQIHRPDGALAAGNGVRAMASTSHFRHIFRALVTLGIVAR